MVPLDNKRALTILHTNDFHNHLTAEKEAKIRERFLSFCEPKLMLDAGDAGGSGNVTFRPGGEPILSRMSDMGYSAMTVGNRDFHVSRMGFRCKLFRAAFPILCANVRPSRPVVGVESEIAGSPLAGSGFSDEPPVRSYIVCQPSPEWKVLIVGLTVPMVTERMWERKLSSYIFEDPVRTAARLVPLLQNHVAPDLTILLTHIGLRRDRELAEAVQGIDLIIGGHSHHLLPNGERIGETLIVQAGSHSRHIGIVEIHSRDNKDCPVLIDSRLEAL